MVVIGADSRLLRVVYKNTKRACDHLKNDVFIKYSHNENFLISSLKTAGTNSNAQFVMMYKGSDQYNNV